MTILGIESSADESGVCVIEATGDFNAGFRMQVLGNALASQSGEHAQYGGIFPNLAKREHARNLVPLLEKALGDAGLLQDGALYVPNLETILNREPELLEKLTHFLHEHGTKPDIDAIAVTHGPGLEPALWVGVNFAKALAKAWDIPIVPVNHMEGHIMAAMIEDDRLAHFEFPLISLLISGGHTELVLSSGWMQYELIGQTRDDAVGEAFDKVARLLGLPYPGGPEISRLAGEAREKNLAQDVPLPRPMIDSNNFDFSFSGLKTAVLRFVEKEVEIADELRMKVAHAFENSVADVLVAKTMRAIEEYGAQTVLVGGGVSANTHIRTQLAKAIQSHGHATQLLVPQPSLSTDNALMIALAGYFRAVRGELAAPDDIRANGNLRLAQKSNGVAQSEIPH
jgi:N6-L-threonylcarbamoyladenine synthase